MTTSSELNKIFNGKIPILLLLFYTLQGTNNHQYVGVGEST